MPVACSIKRRIHLAARIPGFRPGNRGSIPLCVTICLSNSVWSEWLSSKQFVVGSNPTWDSKRGSEAQWPSAPLSAER